MRQYISPLSFLNDGACSKGESTLKKKLTGFYLWAFLLLQLSIQINT